MIGTLSNRGLYCLWDDYPNLFFLSNAKNIKNENAKTNRLPTAAE